MQLNPIFVSNVHDIFGKTGESWLKALPSQLLFLSERWNFRFLEVMPGLTYHFVGLVEMLETGESAIIKIAPENRGILNEANCLECFTKTAPKIVAFDHEQHMILMERLYPGNSLKKLVEMGRDDEATRIICQTIREIQLHQHKKYEFKHLSEFVKTLFILQKHVDKRLLSKAESWFCELTMDRSQDVVLHGDLHHDNILLSGDTWKVIDPHGYIGDPVFEVGSMIFNPYDCFPNDRSLSKIIERRLSILIEELPFDAQRIKAWAFCKTMLSVAWTFEDHAKIDEGEIEIARIIEKLM